MTSKIKIEIGTLQGKPMIFLQGVKPSKEIQDEFAIQGESELAPEIAIPLEMALDRLLLIEDDKASFQD